MYIYISVSELLTLLLETIDFGYPQKTETDLLKLYINSDKKVVKKEESKQQPITALLTGPSVRQQNILYRKNEVFIDVIENVHFLLSNNGKFLKSDIIGEIKINTKLSGYPFCRLGLNEKLNFQKKAIGRKTIKKKTKNHSIVIDDVKFHNSISLDKYNIDRSISFSPPDGLFECASYRVTNNVKIPFKVIPIVKQRGDTSVDYKITIRCLIKKRLFAKNVVIKVPTPKNTAGCLITKQNGVAKYDPATNCIIWKINKFQGESEISLTAEANLLRSKNSHWARPPITLDFLLPGYTSSGLKVKYFKVIEKSYTDVSKYIRYLSLSKGSFQIRI
ncbi:ap-2 complex subunit mu [Anaeramoeba flamelloides]|uniref:Ap-2 complex subunit mu n=1 Tax=Anaeramoeba flamelloides TaxID=1746091 RepID=A0ABQ8YJR4_9EUKA|nr:ap-2 complex subunit mu [Anaeramoeba flamelloides]